MNNKEKNDLGLKLKNNYNLKWNTVCKNLPKMPNILPPVKRIIAFGDVHGDMNVTIESLKIAKVINNNYKYDKNKLPKWIGGDTVIVQLGDQIDSCRFNVENGVIKPCKFKSSNDEANDTNILELFTYLHEEAQKVSGAVYSILGNHELMNVEGNMEYVSHMNLKEFSDDEDSIDISIKNRQKAFSPGNKYANFLGCSRKVVLQIGTNLFAHAGVIEKLAKKYNIDDINYIMSNYLWNEFKNLNVTKKDFYEIFDYEKDGESPFWTRIYGNQFSNGDENCNNYFDDKNNFILGKHYKGYKNSFPVGRLLVGHTPQLNKDIQLRCNKKIVLADYGSSNAFNHFRKKQKEIQVVEILNDNQIRILK